jgi:hypothetical protein
MRSGLVDLNHVSLCPRSSSYLLQPPSKAQFLTTRKGQGAPQVAGSSRLRSQQTYGDRRAIDALLDLLQAVLLGIPRISDTNYRCLAGYLPALVAEGYLLCCRPEYESAAHGLTQNPREVVAPPTEVTDEIFFGSAFAQSR